MPPAKSEKKYVDKFKEAMTDLGNVHVPLKTVIFAGAIVVATAAVSVTFVTLKHSNINVNISPNKGSFR